MIRDWAILVIVLPYFCLAFLSGLLSILLLRSKGSSQNSQRKFLRWYIVGSFSLFPLGYLLLWFFDVFKLIPVFLMAPLVVVAGYVVAQRGNYPRLTFTSMIIGAIWALVSFFPYAFLTVGGYVELPVLWRILTFPVWSCIKLEKLVYGASVHLLIEAESIIPLGPLFVEILYDCIFTMIVLWVFPFLIGGFIGFLVFRICSYLFVRTRRKPNQTLT